MKVTDRTCLALLVGFLVVSGPVFAHHGTAISYDRDNPIELEGTVTEWVWANPHARLFFDVTGADGKVVNWGAETLSPGMFARRGYAQDIFELGDEVRLYMYPSRAGSPIGEIDWRESVFVNGEELLPIE
jgi:hypothetical protein